MCNIVSKRSFASVIFIKICVNILKIYIMFNAKRERKHVLFLCTKRCKWSSVFNAAQSEMSFEFFGTEDETTLEFRNVWLRRLFFSFVQHLRWCLLISYCCTSALRPDALFCPSYMVPLELTVRGTQYLWD